MAKKRKSALEDPQVKFLIDLFLDMIKPLGKDELQYAIENDITLSGIIIENFPGVLIQLRKLAMKYSDRLSKITADAVIEWFQQHRKDLCDLLGSDEGYRWLKKNIDEILMLVVPKDDKWFSEVS